MTAGVAARVLPHDLEAERSILGAILLHSDVLPVATAIVHPADFYRDAHRRIFLAMTALHARETTIDFVTLRHVLEETGHLEAIGGPVYLASLVDGMPRGTNVEAYARIVKDLARRREMIGVATKIADAAYDQRDDDFATLTALAHRELTRVEAETHTQPRVGKWAREMLHERPPTETIEGIAWAGMITVLVSESSAGKTFVLLDAAAAVSAGLSWQGRTTRQGTIAYCSFEGDALGVRLRGLQHHHGHHLDHLAVIRLTEPISPQTTREGEVCSLGERQLLHELDTLQQEITEHGLPPLVLIIIDTVRASMVGSEDSSEHVSAYLRVARRVLAQAPEAACVLAHHAGWQDGETKKKRERGSSSWRGNVDATLYLEAGAYNEHDRTAPLTLTTLKIRDSERPAPIHLLRRRVELNEMDPRGQPVSTCVIERDRRSLEDRQAETDVQTQQVTRHLDLKTLRAIQDRPNQATSQTQLRLLVGGRKVDVGESLSRLIQNGWVQLPEKQRQPYQITTAGLEALNSRATH